MNIERLQATLFAAARRELPSERVPLAFEKRVMANIRRGVTPDVWSILTHAFWRALAPCLGLTLLLGAWTWQSGALTGTEPASDTDLETALYSVFVSADDPE